MRVLNRPLVVRYSLSAGAVAAAFLLAALLFPASGHTYGLLFVGVVIIATWLGGAGPGLFAALLSMASLDYLLRSHLHLRAVGEHDTPPLVVFGLVAFLIILLSVMRLRADAKLRESERSFRATFEQAAVGVAHVSLDGKWLRVNERLCRILGYTRDELLKRTFQEITHADDLEADLSAVRRLVGGEIPTHTAEKRYVRKDGSFVWARRTVSLKHREGGTPEHFIVIVEDISAGKEVEEELVRWREALEQRVEERTSQLRDANRALQESEERFSLIAENIEEAFWMTDVEIETMFYVGPAYERIWGQPRENLYKHPRSFLDAVQPEDKERVIADLARENIGRPFDHEFRIIRPDGSMRWVWNRGFPVREGTGPVTRYVGLAQDITDRKQAEIELRQSLEWQEAVFEGSRDAIFVSDGDFRFVNVNEAACQLTGYSKDELLGMRIPDLHEEMDLEAYKASHSRIMAGEDLLTRAQVLRKDGRRFPAEFSNRRVTVAGVPYMHTTVRDLTARESLESQLRQAQRIEAIGVLAGGVAHDFNNLLTVILGYTNVILQNMNPGDPSTGDLQQIKGAAQRAVSLVSQLLAFSRRQILQPRILDLHEVISDLGKMLTRLIGEDIVLTTTAKPGLGQIKVDPGQIQQVIMNLAVNARDAMPHGGRLTIEAANVEIDENYIRRRPLMQSGSYVMLAISDTGIGMDEETQARIFEPFFTTKGPGKGTGLGLSTVYGIVKQSGGFIWVYSEPGTGSTFKVYLPRVEGESDRFSLQVSEEVDRGGTETILLVEDESSVRILASRILREKGYKVIEAGDGQEALRLAEGFLGTIDLLVTDIVMPEMGGRALFEQLAARQPGTRVLYISGYTDNAVVHHGILDPDVPFLQKPFTPRSLRSRVREVLDALPAGGPSCPPPQDQDMQS